MSGHEHVYLGRTHADSQRRTRIVIGVTAAMMIAEIVCGAVFRSMALMADGWHMATHVGALSLTAFAYSYAHRHARDPRFSFGTGKLGDLAGFASAVVLGLIALWIGFESCVRLARPVAIEFDGAIAVAALGLAVNVVSAVVLGGGRDAHEHAHEHGDHHEHVHRDNNLRSAYLHVLADALTSVLAIVGLAAGKLAGWSWMDAVVGIVGAAMIARWALSLIRDSALVLLDVVPSRDLVEAIRARLEIDGDVLGDLHLWRVGPGHAAAIVSVVSDRPQPPSFYKGKLADLADLSHVTVEVELRGAS
jgi:cation diffusion facilitator family transporter